MNLSTSMRLILALLFISLLSGCELLSEESFEIDVRTDAKAYAPDETVTLSVVNRSEETLYFYCGGVVYLHQMVGGEIDATWQVSGISGCFGAERLEPGNEIQFDVVPGAIANSPPARFDRRAEYVFEIEVYHGLRERDRKQLPLSDRRSNRFSILR